jgi:Galactose oxidase, central domain
VYLPEQKRLHQFNDLWVLDTDTWQWERKDASVDHPAPSPRDRSSIVPLDGHRLLIYGGADATNKRLDDVWIYDLNTSSWSEVVIPSGSKPRARCSSTLFSLGNRVLVFGGDIVSVGPSNDLWSLRGVINDNVNSNTDSSAATTPQWTQLQLPGAVPAPRRGQAAAPAGPWGGYIFSGGRSEQKSLLGIKKQSEYLMDIVLLQRKMETLQWRSVEPAINSSGGGGGGGAAVPVGREKHTLCALKDGRFFLYGGELFGK